MKKFLKVLGIICLAVFIWIMAIGGVLFLFSRQAKENIDEMTKDMEVNTEDGKEVTGDNPEISVNITKDAFANQQDVSNDYYNTMQEALLNSTISLEPEEQYRRNIDEVIKEFESDEYALLVYRSVKDKKEEAFNVVRFKVKRQTKKREYKCEKMRGTTARYNSFYLHTSTKELIEGQLIGSDIIGSIGVNPDDERFMYGRVCEEFLEKGESIYNLKVEGQKPDEIIEHTFLGRTWYFWYYNDLQSDKPSSELEVTLKE